MVHLSNKRDGSYNDVCQGRSQGRGGSRGPWPTPMAREIKIEGQFFPLPPLCPTPILYLDIVIYSVYMQRHRIVKKILIQGISHTGNETYIG